jgi:hypothetical protein
MNIKICLESYSSTFLTDVPLYIVSISRMNPQRLKKGSTEDGIYLIRYIN